MIVAWLQEEFVVPIDVIAYVFKWSVQSAAQNFREYSTGFRHFPPEVLGLRQPALRLIVTVAARLGFTITRR